jgi:Gluconate 2-dehydrogenase subunit 3
MKRRRAILGIFAGTAAVFAVGGGYKWFQVSKEPDLEYLVNNTPLIGALTDIILPRTEIPGALDVGAHNYLIVILRDCTDRKTQNNFISGLKEIQETSLSKYGKLFQDLSPANQQELFLKFESDSRASPGIMTKIKSRLMGKSFISVLKEYTVEGYCMSRTGAADVLTYAAVPGHYHGCIPMEKDQRSWATR